MAKAETRKIFPISDTQAAIGAGAIMAFFVIWALIVGAGDQFVCWVGGKDNLSGWVQAIGSIGAILGVWWQTNKQIAAAAFARQEEERRKKDDTLLRARFLIERTHSTCIDMLSFFNNAKEQRQLTLTAYALSGMPVTDRVLGNGPASNNLGQYKEVLNSALSNFSLVPYWELQNLEMAQTLLRIQNRAGLCLLGMEHDPSSFPILIDLLIRELDSALKTIEREANSSA